jgi:hypothetical protein
MKKNYKKDIKKYLKMKMQKKNYINITQKENHY